MLPPKLKSASSHLEGFGRAYATILFSRHRISGALFFLATLAYPNIGLAGLLAAVVASITATQLRLPNLDGGLHVFNSLLVGLSLGAVYQLDAYLALLIAISAAFAVFVTAATANVLWRLGALPALSVPFVMVAVAAALAAKGYGNLELYLAPYLPREDWFGAVLDRFFISLGAVYFSTHPAAGLLLFLGIVWQSRYAALLCICGYAVGRLVFDLLSGSSYDAIADWNAFNYALTAIALGGIFCIPSVGAFALAMIGAACSAFLTASMQSLFLLHQLPVMAFPFLFTTLTFLFALSLRSAPGKPWLVLTNPATPEVNYERARLAQARSGGLNSVPLHAPFFGTWNVYQGFNGPHTHQGLWQHALDFFISHDGRSFEDKGAALTDYHCFALPVVSPAYGRVVRIRQNIPDNAPGEVNVQYNWGNFVLLRLENGLHVLIAHLLQNSIKVNEGDYVYPGTPLGACGNSGRSPQPHVHMQLQRDARLGRPTLPFHLANVIHFQSGESGRFCLATLPKEGDSIRAADRDPRLANPLHLPVGRTLTYRVEDSHRGTRQITFRVELTLFGRFRLVCNGGASCAIQETDYVLACFDRTGPREPALALWMLAVGLTPFSAQADRWSDAPAADLLPLSPMQRLVMHGLFPLGAGLDSEYQRTWDKAHSVWRQRANHVLKIGPLNWQAATEADLCPDVGFRRLALRCGTREIEATLTDVGLSEDAGVPEKRQSLEDAAPGLTHTRDNANP